VYTRLLFERTNWAIFDDNIRLTLVNNVNGRQSVGKIRRPQRVKLERAAKRAKEPEELQHIVALHVIK